MDLCPKVASATAGLAPTAKFYRGLHNAYTVTISANPGHTSSPDIVKMKVRDVIKMLEADGWLLKNTKGSHRQFKHRTKPGKVTVAGKPSTDVPPGTLKSIYKQAGLEKEDEQ